MASSDPFFELLLLKQRLLKYKPDLVVEVVNKSDIDDVIVYGGNERFVSDGSVQWQKPPWFEPLFGMSYLCRIIAFNIFNLDWLFLKPGERAAKTNHSKNLIYNCIMDFKQLSHDHGFELLIVFHPLQEELISESFSLQDLSIKTKNTLRVNVTNMRAVFNSANADGKLNIQDCYWPVDGHFTSKGNQVFADGLTEKIATMNLIKP